ncbi:MAG TPA: tetratricopeptide repeat protein [Candidatus Acidoferrum sp.]|nr:tetratricopeptide repeat protein [Candidatus Acidoferrum sp.]
MTTIPLAIMLTISSLPALSTGIGQAAGSPPPLRAGDVAKLEAMAETGDPDAQLRVATAYANGEGVARNAAVAAKWYLKAAERGSAVAQTYLGVAYMTGDGVERDKTRALILYRLAARQNYADAMFNLGTAYYNGDGVNINDAVAYAWFLLAKDAGSKNAEDAVRRSETELKPAVILEGLKEIARIYERGNVLQKNESLSAHWWQKAAEKGDQDARIVIADRFLSARGVKEDTVEAKKWCTEAVKASEAEGIPDHRAYYCLGIVAERESDPKKARDWYEKASRLRSVQGKKALARLCAKGEGGKVDRPQAWILYLEVTRSHDEAVIPQLKELKAEMSNKEWNEVKKRLTLMHIDLEDVTFLLEKKSSPAK